MRGTSGFLVAMLGFSIAAGATRAGGPSAANPAPELQHLRLLVSLPPPELGGGTLVYAPGDERPRNFEQMLTEGAEVGDLGHVPVEHRDSVSRAVEDFMPDSLARRADKVFRTKQELQDFLQGKLDEDSRVEGVLHCTFPEATQLSFSAFRGEALFSFEGPVVLADVTLEDPGRDRLTLVSAQSIHVAGERVEAGLVSLVPGIGQVSFAGPARVRGFVFSALFPAGERLGEVQIAQ